jgi:hypothetical protein
VRSFRLPAMSLNSCFMKLVLRYGHATEWVRSPSTKGMFGLDAVTSAPKVGRQRRPNQSLDQAGLPWKSGFTRLDGGPSRFRMEHAGSSVLRWLPRPAGYQG